MVAQDCLSDDCIREVVYHLNVCDMLQARVSHEWRRNVDAHIRRRCEEGRLREYLSSMRISVVEVPFLYAVRYMHPSVSPVSDSPVARYKCACCNRLTTGILTCDCRVSHAKRKARIINACVGPAIVCCAVGFIVLRRRA